MGKKSSTDYFLKGFLIGGTIGAVTALLWAPQSGEETRAQIQEKSVELREKAEATYAEMQEQIEVKAAELRTKMEELSAKIDEVVVQTRGELAQKTAELAEEVAPEMGSAAEASAADEVVAKV